MMMSSKKDSRMSDEPTFWIDEGSFSNIMCSYIVAVVFGGGCEVDQRCFLLLPVDPKQRLTREAKVLAGLYTIHNKSVSQSVGRPRVTDPESPSRW